jgi:hypothetical protein
VERGKGYRDIATEKGSATELGDYTMKTLSLKTTSLLSLAFRLAGESALSKWPVLK